MSVAAWPHISRNTGANFHCLKLATYGPISVLLWWRCDTLCTSVFADDVMFAHNRPGNASRAPAHNDSPVSAPMTIAFLFAGKSQCTVLVRYH